MSFQRAKRLQAKLKLALYGPSGSGKTFSALAIAKGLGGKIAVIDSERGSSALYGQQYEFDVATLEQFSAQAFTEKLTEAVKGGYDVIILDSITHEWMAVKERVDEIAAASKSNNTFVAWREPSSEHNRFVNAILTAPVHVICTMREKDEIVMTPNENNKMEPMKMGVKPDQRKGLEYEFTTIFRIERKGHVATAEKDRTNLFDKFNDPITPQVGEVLKQWLEAGQETEETRKASQVQKNYLFTLLAQLNTSYDAANVKAKFEEITGKHSMSFWTELDAENVKEYLEKKIKEKSEESKKKEKPNGSLQQTANDSTGKTKAGTGMAHHENPKGNAEQKK